MTEIFTISPFPGREKCDFCSDSPTTDGPAFIRVSYTDLVPPDPGLELEDQSDHHKALQAFAYLLAKETGDKTLVQHAMTEPNLWMQLKAATGKWMLSAGARLTADFERQRNTKINATVRYMHELIEHAQSVK